MIIDFTSLESCRNSSVEYKILYLGFREAGAGTVSKNYKETYQLGQIKDI